MKLLVLLILATLLASVGFSQTNAPITLLTTNPIPASHSILADRNFRIALRALEQSSKSNVLKEPKPKITTSNPRPINAPPTVLTLPVTSTGTNR
jgi:hypothetical protein